MEGLPNDALLLVLNKLAVQDPPSLLRVICAVKPLYGLAKANPNIWKKAFYGPDLWEDTMTSDERLLFEQQSAELEARLGAMDILNVLQPAAGFKELVEARWVKQNSRPSAMDFMLQDTLRQLSSETDTASFLFAIRLRGSLLAWGYEAPVGGSYLGNAVGAAFWRGVFHRAYASPKAAGMEELIFSAPLINTFQEPWIFFTHVPQTSAKFALTIPEEQGVPDGTKGSSGKNKRERLGFEKDIPCELEMCFREALDNTLALMQHIKLGS
ncbi:hypothetical protein KFL_005630090 [Klebsormidium nitens]|uniref:Uncharacterized protein n=1 Tax=Klebsormidium nitens TaxID=105231 RepID=A0A1Y1ILY8_KLENI|nr:hypothetical protein KFL_005630090 [Klebsormidium nitens]|eukprot:GAQ89796.1 hypothetical protein KFL_005630090 [Klebsormidium nitens]